MQSYDFNNFGCLLALSHLLSSCPKKQKFVNGVYMTKKQNVVNGVYSVDI